MIKKISEIIAVVLGILAIIGYASGKKSPEVIIINEPTTITEKDKRIKKLEEKLKKLNTVGEIVRMTAEETAGYYADKKDNSINFNHDVIEDDNSLSAHFYFDKTIFFQETHYNNQHAIERDKFIEALISFTNSLSKVCQGNAQASSVTFEGSSDTSGRGVTTLGDKTIQIYQGEYGEIDVNAKINGQNKRVHFKKDAKLNNSQLAFMRGYGVYYLFRDELRKRGIELPENIINFIGQETNGHGEENRYGRITFKIDNPKKECISYAEND